MKNLKILSLILFVPMLIISCKTPQSMLSEGVSQGITGQVMWYEGDLMPGIGKEPAEGKPIQREIFIYEATSPDQAEVHEGQFYSGLKSKLVQTVNSDEDGRFIVALEPGTYSVFVNEPEGLFANRFDQAGIINPVTINRNELVNILIKVDYKAAY